MEASNTVTEHVLYTYPSLKNVIVNTLWLITGFPIINKLCPYIYIYIYIHIYREREKERKREREKEREIERYIYIERERERE